MSDPVVVVGGGPAGLVAAISCRLAGLPVVVFEPSPVPVDKGCGEGLMPDAVASLHRLGVDLAGLGRAFRGIRWIDGDLAAEGRFQRDGGIGLRRTELSRRLAGRAEEIGVERIAERVDRTDGRAVVTGSRRIAARVILLADGLGSRLREQAGWRVELRGSRRFGLRRHLEVAPWSDLVEVHWGDGVEAYVTPVGSREVGVAFLWCGPPARFEDLLLRFPVLRDRLTDAPFTSGPRGAGPFHRAVLGEGSPDVVLLGDAAGYVDPITGEGLAIAFAEGEAVGPALAAGRIAEFRRRQGEIRKVPELLARALLALEPRPRLRRNLIATFAARPHLFDRVLAIQAGRVRLREFGAGDFVTLVAGLIGRLPSDGSSASLGEAR